MSDQPLYTIQTQEQHVVSMLKHTTIANDMQIAFWGDHLELSFWQRYFGKNDICDEFHFIAYDSITKITYAAKTRTYWIFGDIDFCRWRHEKDGSLPDTPTRQKFVEGGSVFFTPADEQVDFRSAFETYAHITVRDVDSYIG